jgi:uncharacterized protein with ATP-grasp and redox domains
MNYKLKYNITFKQHYNPNIYILDNVGEATTKDEAIFEKIGECFYKWGYNDKYYIIPDAYMERICTYYIDVVDADGNISKGTTIYNSFDEAFKMVKKLNKDADNLCRYIRVG